MENMVEIVPQSFIKVDLDYIVRDVVKRDNRWNESN